MLDAFIKYLNRQIGQPYIWGGQHIKLTPETYETVVKQKDPEKLLRKRSIAFCKNAFKKADVLYGYDCSGLGMYWIQNVRKLSKADMNANALMGKCKAVSKTKLSKGCWVFRVDKTGRAYHIGYVVDNNLNVIEAQGRAYGVVKRAINASGTTYWNAYGIPEYFAEEIKAPETFKVARLLKLGMNGKDVTAVKQALVNQGFLKKSSNDVFGNGTLRAVKKAQKAHGLKVDGIVGKDTVTALGGEWIA